MTSLSSTFTFLIWTLRNLQVRWPKMLIYATLEPSEPFLKILFVLEILTRIPLKSFFAKISKQMRSNLSFIIAKQCLGNVADLLLLLFIFDNLYFSFSFCSCFQVEHVAWGFWSKRKSKSKSNDLLMLV